MYNLDLDLHRLIYYVICWHEVTQIISHDQLIEAMQLNIS